MDTQIATAVSGLVHAVSMVDAQPTMQTQGYQVARSSQVQAAAEIGHTAESPYLRYVI